MTKQISPPRQRMLDDLASRNMSPATQKCYMHGTQRVSGNRRTTVKAIRAHSFGGPEVLQLETVDDPVAGPGEVVVEVRAAGSTRPTPTCAAAPTPFDRNYPIHRVEMQVV